MYSHCGVKEALGKAKAVLFSKTQPRCLQASAWMPPSPSRPTRQELQTVIITFSPILGIRSVQRQLQNFQKKRVRSGGWGGVLCVWQRSRDRQREIFSFKKNQPTETPNHMETSNAKSHGCKINNQPVALLYMVFT